MAVLNIVKRINLFRRIPGWFEVFLNDPSSERISFSSVAVTSLTDHF